MLVPFGISEFDSSMQLNGVRKTVLTCKIYDLMLWLI